MADCYDQLMRPLYDRLASREAGSGRAEAIPEAPGHEAHIAVSPEPESQLAALHRQATILLREQLLGHIYAQDHLFFENLIIDVLLAMGYGSRRRDLVRRMGRSHDGGIDGIISQDELGLDVILLQAKRLKPGSCVSGSQVRDFVGSLEANHAQKGVFVTTGQFTTQARSAVKQITRRVVLINGNDLTGLMIRHNIGVRAKESYVFKSIVRDYFSSPSHDTPVRASDSNQFLR